MNIYKERIIQFQDDNWHIRVWIDDNSPHPPDAEYEWAARRLPRDRDAASVAEAIVIVDGANAVEVKNQFGIGVVFYKDWP